jgi:hypothetical protein
MLDAAKRIVILLGTFVFISILSVQAAPQYGSVSKVISVYDGDTFRVNIDSLSPIVGKNIATLGLQSDICKLTN